MNEVKRLTDDEQALFEKVAEVCSLELAVPDRYLSDDSPSQDVLKELVERGMEVLGTYDPDTSEVTLFVVRCVQTAREFKVRPRDVELIVLAHEWAHKIQHRGTLPNGQAHWEKFPKRPTAKAEDLAEVEDLAQKAAYMALHRFADGMALQRTMVLMADYQPEPYRRFLESGGPPDEALAELRERMKEVRDASKEPQLRHDPDG